MTNLLCLSFYRTVIIRKKITMKIWSFGQTKVTLQQEIYFASI